MASPRSERTINRSAAAVIPLFMIAGVVYATWVVVVKVAVEYLIHPSKRYQQLGIPPRHGAAIAILVLYFILLPPMALCYLRTLQIIWTDPGYTSLGQKAEKDTAPGLEQFYTKDVFVCDSQGRPIWCEKCKNWKPDRTHHCSQVGRCVYRMDHFCPWVGGIVSENNLKFFIQFNSYGALYTTFVMIVMAVFLAERKQKAGDVQATWAVALALAAMFCLFSVGMAASTLQLTSQNLTTIENLNRGNAVYYLAALVESPGPVKSPVGRSGYGPGIVTYPNQAHQSQPLQDSGERMRTREYIILQTEAGDNPWDIGPLRNLKSILGDNWYDWLLPIKYSPCTKHDRDDSHFEFGPVVEKLKRQAGLIPQYNSEKPSRHRHKRRHRRHKREEIRT
ncbi:zf-DHHC-domain-containing protein [Glonium stellatum]|uniref:Palmitoyltransferase n=1 Tax=Glonium stellatum TaxID=574774 RepID=A0A8E2ET49_9PEZI|nr:zf-DHHC-domain-containing protein [Glonium stellatum]